MSGRIAHAFDNVLTGIVGFAELTLTQTARDSAPHQYVGEVLKAAQAGVQLTQQLHTLSRCAAAGPGPTSLAVLVADEQGRYAPPAGSLVRMHFAVPSDLPPVAMDADALRTALGHVLDNARESVGSSGTIAITARQIELAAGERGDWLGNPEPGPALEVLITDSGPGLNAEARQRLFQEPFFTTKPRHRGVGLAIVCRTLFTQGGGFRLDSGPSGGAVARLLLPIAAAHPAPQR